MLKTLCFNFWKKEGHEWRKERSFSRAVAKSHVPENSLVFRELRKSWAASYRWDNGIQLGFIFSVGTLLIPSNQSPKKSAQSVTGTPERFNPRLKTCVPEQGMWPRQVRSSLSLFPSWTSSTLTAEWGWTGGMLLPGLAQRTTPMVLHFLSLLFC